MATFTNLQENGKTLAGETTPVYDFIEKFNALLSGAIDGVTDEELKGDKTAYAAAKSREMSARQILQGNEGDNHFWQIENLRFTKFYNEKTGNWNFQSIRFF